MLSVVLLLLLSICWLPTWVLRAPHQGWWQHFVMGNNLCLMHVMYSVYLTKRYSWRRSPIAYVLLMNVSQAKTKPSAIPIKILSMAASFILFPFLAYLSSFNHFFLLCTHSPFLWVCLCLSFTLSLSFLYSPSFMYYFWFAPNEHLSLMLTYTNFSPALLLGHKFANTEKKNVINVALAVQKVFVCWPNPKSITILSNE